ncbi:MAG: UvrD-helicase domain-containing protein [Candidatus Omnitrophica bacterium]|nr:UvrD-helicase domain-containing protein [Candidatus Omnitrophota bacterium]
MCKNRLIIAAAGAGKTTYLVKEALKIKNKNVLLTTFTDANEEEIRKKIIGENGCIPGNVTIQTWFSFLLQHGVKPYQGGIFEKRINGLSLVGGQSRQFTKESDIEKFYFDNNKRIFSDKISRFVLKCNKQNNGKVINRLTRIYSHIFIDEVQDLAGFDLEILKLFFCSASNILLVGDPRQGTYSTNNSSKNKQFKRDRIVNFFDDIEIQKQVKIDCTSLTTNFRSNQKICDFANKIFPNHAKTTSGQNESTSHDGVFLVREKDIEVYFKKYPCCVQLRDSIREKRINKKYSVFNFGNSKGLSFDRTLIYPTKPILDWIKDDESNLKPMSRCRFYVAVTRSKHSVGIVYDYEDGENINGIDKFR